MEDLIKEISESELQQIGTRITEGVTDIIEHAKQRVAVYLNAEVSMTYWRIGK